MQKKLYAFGLTPLLLTAVGIARFGNTAAGAAPTAGPTAEATRGFGPASVGQGSASGIDVPVPAACTPAVNLKLEQMIRANSRNYTENVMVCGIATKTTVNSGGQHGSHHIITLAVTLPDDGPVSVQVAINDTLDGPITAAPGASVFAFGEGYVTGGAWVAGVHDVHCSTHPTADNGWVVVNGVKTPASCPMR
jgi:hypothetical protein